VTRGLPSPRGLVPLLLGMLALSGECNDTLVRAVGGGIVPIKSSNIRMVKERLEISTQRVKVNYVFLSDAGEDATETLAFPMPEYPAVFGISGSDTVRPLEDFATRVEGSPVASRRVRLAKLGERDITAELRSLGLSEQEIFGGSGACRYGPSAAGSQEFKCHYTPAQKRKLEQLCDGCSGSPGWKISETLYWTQTFPARKPLHVAHEYAAKAGAYFHSRVDAWSVRDELAADRELAGNACIDEGVLASAARVATKGLVKSTDPRDYTSVDINIQSVEYVLGTGKNWKGPIEDFELVIRKDRPEQLVSVCFPGKAVRAGPRQISFRHSDFMPQDRLLVYFVDADWDLQQQRPVVR